MTAPRSANITTGADPDITVTGRLTDGAGFRGRITGRWDPRLLLERYVFVLVWLAMAAAFAIAAPHNFLQSSTVQVISSSGAIYVLLGLGSLCGAVVGEFDLSTAFVMGLSAAIVPTLVSLHGTGIWLAVAAAMLVSMACGALIGLLVVRLGVNPFITTLGLGTALTGLGEGISHNTPVAGLSAGFEYVATAQVLGVEAVVWYSVAAAIALAYLLAFTPLGRHMLSVGSNREVARLAGVRVDRIRFGAYVAGATLAGAAGVLLSAQLGGFQASSATDYLLPAVATLFLSSVVVQPGRFNPIGVLIAGGSSSPARSGSNWWASTAGRNRCSTEAPSCSPSPLSLPSAPRWDQREPSGLNALAWAD